MSDSDWGVHVIKRRLRYLVSRVEYSNFAGSWYELAKDERGKVLRFWFRKNAQAHADKLNKEAP